MPVVRVLLLTHVGLTALLLVLFALVVLCQRLSPRVRASVAAPALPDPYPADPAPAGPAATRHPALPAGTTGARREQPAAAASVLQWTLDLRTPSASPGRPVDAVLSRTS